MSAELSDKSLRDLRDLFAERASRAPEGSPERAELSAKAAEYQHRLSGTVDALNEKQRRPKKAFRLFGRTWGRA